MSASTTSHRASPWSDLAGVLRLGVGHWWRPQTESIDRFYSMCPESVAQFLGGRLLNFGYWNDGETDQQSAARSLVHRVGQLADLEPCDQVLDVGCGFGAAAFIFSDEYRVNKVVSVNVTENHLAFARSQARSSGVADRVQFQFADATELPFDDNSFDKVIALESAFHFDSRVTFLQEAARVLKPGGRLTLADAVPLQSSRGRLRKYLASRLWMFPLVNNYGPVEYERRLEATGFQQITVQSVGDKVYPGYVDWTLTPENRVRLQQQLGRTKATLYRWQTELLGSLFRKCLLDYLLITVKPS